MPEEWFWFTDSAELTGRRRYRLQKQRGRSDLVVLEVEELRHRRRLSGEARDMLVWRDARATDLFPGATDTGTEAGPAMVPRAA